MSLPLKSNEVGRIWKWIHSTEKAKDSKPDVVLPDGFLFDLSEKATFRNVCEKFTMIAALPNQDLVLGPPEENKTGTSEDRQLLGTMKKEFTSDMHYLKHAMLNGTIYLEDLPPSN